MQYIKNLDGAPKFYASYGLFMHKLLESFYKGEISKEQMLLKFLFDFKKEVEGGRPKASTVKKYIESGVEYINSFEKLPGKVLEVETKHDYEIRGIPFTGIIDLVLEDEKGIYIVDHKSRDLKPRSKRKKPTLQDEELDDILRQLYLYAPAIKQKYGNRPYKVCINCFRVGRLIEEQFDDSAYESALNWAEGSINEIMDNADGFSPHLDYFACHNICDLSDDCCYFNMQWS